MGVKTDYLKDCASGESITVQEIINLKKLVGTFASSDDILGEIEPQFSKLSSDFNIALDKTKKEIEDNVDKKISPIKTKLDAVKEKVDEIYNKVVAFNFKNIVEIERNMNNDITKIVFDDDSYIIVEYINLPYQNEFINYMPSKLNYYVDNKLIAIEELNYKTESILRYKNLNFNNS